MKFICSILNSSLVITVKFKCIKHAHSHHVFLHFTKVKNLKTGVLFGYITHRILES